MKMKPVVSSNIAAIGHSGTTLRVQFRDGKCYEYQDVTPEQYDELMAAESHGKHLYRMGIKGNRI